MSKITLSTVGNIATQPTSAQTTINDNFEEIQVAVDNTLSRDGTSPNQMNATLDMNSNRVLNLPVAQSSSEPVTLGTFNSATIGSGNVPAGGTANQVLAKNSSTSYDMSWKNQSALITAGNNIQVTGTSPAVVATVNNPTFTSITGLATLNISGLTASSAIATDSSKNLVSVANTGTGSNVLATSPTIVTPVISSIVNTGTLTLPTSTDTLVGRGTTDTLTNKTLTSPVLTTPNIGAAAGTSLNLSGLTVSQNVMTDGSKNLVTVANTGSGNNVLATTPTLVTPVLGVATATSVNGSTVSPGHYSGEPSTGSASSGEIGEYVSSTLIKASATSITTAIPKTVTSISLTAGDWDVRCVGCFSPANTTSVTQIVCSISGTTNTLDATEGKLGVLTTPATIYDGSTIAQVSLPPYRISLSGTTTVFLVAQSNFTVSTNVAYGIISARRVR